MASVAKQPRFFAAMINQALDCFATLAMTHEDLPMSDSDDFYSKILQGYTVLSRAKKLDYKYNARKLVYQRSKVKLYHYEPKVKHPLATPLLVVFATVNRPEILDLFPQTSFIGGLLENGLDVYLLDWGYPDADDTDISISDYVTDYLHFCVQYIRRQHQSEQINLLGICQGGVLSLCYATLFKTIKNLVLISTPIDFHTHDNNVGKLLSTIDVNQLINTFGNVSGEWLTNFFVTLRPFELVGKKYLRFIDQLDNDVMTERFLYVEKWLNDAPDQTATSFRELLEDFYQANKLIQGKIDIYGRKVRLDRLTIPVLNIMASEDEIVPMSATSGLKEVIGSQDYTQEIFPSGHIGIYVSEKVGKRMPKAIAEWLKQRNDE